MENNINLYNLARSHLKTFFIVSINLNLKDKFECSLVGEDATNLQILYSYNWNYGEEKYIASVYSFDVIYKEEDNNNPNKDYKAKILLTQKSFIMSNMVFEHTIFFKKTKNNFIYDNLNFQDYQSFIFGKYSAPKQFLSTISKFSLFKEALKRLNAQLGDSLSISLFHDSLKFIFTKGEGNFEIILHLLLFSYNTKEIKELLLAFESYKFYNLYESKEYSNILDKLEKEPNDFIKFCISEDEKNKCYKSFYSLLLVYRFNYEKEKFRTLLRKGEISKYLAESIINNYEYFKMGIPDELMDEIMKQNNFTYESILNIVFYSNSINKLILFLNKNYKTICEIIENTGDKYNDKYVKEIIYESNYKYSGDNYKVSFILSKEWGSYNKKEKTVEIQIGRNIFMTLIKEKI